MTHSKYQHKKVEAIKKRARLLYQSGLSLRDVKKIIGKSHEWIRTAVNEPVHNSLDKD